MKLLVTKPAQLTALTHPFAFSQALAVIKATILAQPVARSTLSVGHRVVAQQVPPEQPAVPAPPTPTPEVPVPTPSTVPPPDRSPDPESAPSPQA